MTTIAQSCPASNDIADIVNTNHKILSSSWMIIVNRRLMCASVLRLEFPIPPRPLHHPTERCNGRTDAQLTRDCVGKCLFVSAAKISETLLATITPVKLKNIDGRRHSHPYHHYKINMGPPPHPLLVRGRSDLKAVYTGNVLRLLQTPGDPGQAIRFNSTGLDDSLLHDEQPLIPFGEDMELGTYEAVCAPPRSLTLVALLYLSYLRQMTQTTLTIVMQTIRDYSKQRRRPTVTTKRRYWSVFLNFYITVIFYLRFVPKMMPSKLCIFRVRIGPAPSLLRPCPHQRSALDRGRTAPWAPFRTQDDF